MKTKTMEKEYIKDLSRQFRKEPTKSEKIVWDLLRNRKFKDLKFRRQHPIDRYVLDFYCAEHKLVIEIDGTIHTDKNQAEYDILRQVELENKGFKFLRLKTNDVEKNPKIIYKEIETFLNKNIK